MKEIILVKNGEIALKGLNRSTFEDILIKNIKTALKGLGLIRVKRAQSTIHEPKGSIHEIEDFKSCRRQFIDFIFDAIIITYNK